MSGAIESPILSPASTHTAPTVQPSREQLRAAKRESERVSRQRRRDNLERMRATVQLLEQLVVALPLVGGLDDAGWDEFLDDDVKRVRSLLRRLVPVNETVKALVAQSSELHALLAEHKLASQALRALVDAQQREDDWDLEVQRWKALARIHFRPWTEQQYLAELDMALQEAHGFSFSENRHSTGLNFMGWEDSLRLLEGGTVLQFSLHKTFRGHDLTRHVDFIKSLYRDTELYQKVVLAGRARGSVDVLQQLAPNAAIVMFHERYDGNDDLTIHAITLVADVETQDGAIQCMRSIRAPEVMRAFQSETDQWIQKVYWMQHDILDRSQPRHACDYRASLRGTLAGPDPIFLHLWLFEVLGSLVRGEALLAGGSMLTW